MEKAKAKALKVQKITSPRLSQCSIQTRSNQRKNKSDNDQELVWIHFYFFGFKSEMNDKDFSNNILKIFYPFISLLKHVENKKLKLNPNKS